MERISIFGFILVILYLAIIEIACNGHTNINNIQSEQKALIDFKNSLTDPNSRLSSWKGSNYCYWEGISCENGTLVVSIDLHNPYPYPPENVYENQSYMNLSGVISPSLIKLKYLKYLDLSFNSFKGIPIPQFIGSLKNLIYLNLSHCGFIGAIPSNLGNLSNLHYLDLSSEYTYAIDYEYPSDLYIENIEWVTNLVSLKHLSANNVNLSTIGSQWIEVLNKLPILTELHLDGCSLFGSIPSPSFVNFTALAIISISSNKFNSTFPEWLLNVDSLEWIDISSNDLHGRIPLGLSKLPNLQYLNLSRNYYLEGDISELLRKSWRKMEFLDLFGNYLHGSIPSSIGNFCNLQYLDLSDNNLNGSLPEIIKGSKTCNSKSILPNLRELDLSGNQLMGKLPNWLGELKTLRRLRLSYEKLEGPIPTMQRLEFLDLGGNELNGSMLDGIGQLSQLKELWVYSDQLIGTLSEQHFWKLSQLESLHLQLFRLNVSSNWVPHFKLTTLYMSSCDIGPAFPTWLQSQKNLQSLHLLDTSISSFIPNWFGNISFNTEELDLSYNQLQGSIPSSIGNFCNLQYLDLSYNNLNESLPEIINGSETCDSKSPLPNLRELDLSFNQLQGSIPSSIGDFCNLQYLHLSDNNLNGSLLEIINGSKTYNSKSHLPNLRELDLSYNQLIGKLPNWLGELKNLRSLKLSDNKLEGPIPASLSRLQWLESLSLGGNKLQGSVPSFIGNLSNLENLDFSSNQLSGTLSEQHFWKLSKLKSLYLDSNSFRLDVSSNWTPPFQLGYLSMSSCPVGPAFPSWLQSQNNLISLDLSNASISSSIPNWFWNISSNLAYLILSHNQLQGQLPNSKIDEFLPELLFLSLSGNRITGTIPYSIGHLSSLEVIDFSSNNLIGSIPSTISNCSSLIALDFGNNNLFGKIPQSLGQLQLLKSLHLNHNKLSGELPSSLQNLTSLDVLDLSYNKLWGQIPAWIGTAFANLVILNLRSNTFSGRLPSMLSNLSSLHVLDLAQNNLMGKIPVTLFELKAMAQDRNMGTSSLYHNWISSKYKESLILITKGLIFEYRRTLSLVVSIDLSDNQLQGQLPNSNISAFLPKLLFLSLKGNRIIGTIPDSIGHFSSLEVIDFSSNNLIGSIPSTISNCSSLIVLDLRNNNLFGKIPQSLGQLQQLKSLHLNHNNLSGELPSSLRNIRGLDVLDLSYNQLWGQLPAWIGTAFTNLVILKLRSNMFFGRLPSQLSNLSSLHVLDLAQNNLTGEIPVTLVELKAMTQEQLSIYQLRMNVSSLYEERLEVITKGQILKYSRILSLVVSIDLSDNNLSGEFPEVITKLFGLVFLNLSMNHITGRIPESISKLSQLSSLDLSSNKLFGSIPSSMSSLSFLGYLNLSNNNFSGKISFIGHMSTFTESAFTGNPNLCGTLLVIKCQDEDSDKRQSDVEDKIGDAYIDQWFYLSIGLGFAMGILVPYFVLAMERSWCDAYFDFVDKIVKWLLFRRRVTNTRNHAI